MSDPAVLQDAWSRYWGSGQLHSLPGSFEHNYGGPMRAFWANRFAALRQQVRIVDLCTGNGPLVQLAIETGPSHLRIDGVDRADIRPELPGSLGVKAGRVTFHKRVSIESMPFDDRSFDMAVSQYGIEYAAVAGTMREVARVLRRDALLVAVLHHLDSAISRVARAELGHIDWLLDGGGFVDTLTQVLPYAARARAEADALRADAAAARARSEFNAAAAALTARMGTTPVPDPLREASQRAGSLLRLAAQQGQSDDAVNALALYRRALAEHRLRLADLLRCALDDAGMDAFRARSEDAGLAVETVGLMHHDNGELMGWTFTARKGG